MLRRVSRFALDHGWMVGIVALVGSKGSSMRAHASLGMLLLLLLLLHVGTCSRLLPGVLEMSPIPTAAAAAGTIGTRRSLVPSLWLWWSV